MDYEKVAKLPPEMKHIFNKFKAMVLNNYGPEEANDVQIHRFLKARDFNFEQAGNMLNKHIQWRKNMKPIFSNFKLNELQAKYIRITLVEFLNEGYPLVHIDFGNLDLKGLLKSVKANVLLNGVLWEVSEIEKQLDLQSKKHNKIIDQWMLVINFENISLLQVLYKPNIEILFQLLSFYEDNFPERLYTVYCVNVSPVFALLFNIVKVGLSANTLSKVKLFGQGGWREELLKHIDAENLPKHLGGKKTYNGDPYCNLLKIDGPVPKQCYFRSKERRVCSKKHIKRFVIPKNETFDIAVDIVQIASEISWEFESEKGDVSFGLLYQDKDTLSTKVVLPLKLVNAHLEIEDGSHLCQKEGTYILRWDNTHSWLREKLIFCAICVTKPDKGKLIITR